MQVKKYNLTKSGRKFTGKDGQEKTLWDNVGSYTEFIKDDGSISRIVEIPAIGLVAQVYPVKEEKQETIKSTVTSPSEDYPNGLDVSQIPF